MGNNVANRTEVVVTAAALFKPKPKRPTKDELKEKLQKEIRVVGHSSIRGIYTIVQIPWDALSMLGV